MKKVVAYITSGYPSIVFTNRLLKELQPYVDIVELGIPFSDPVADGEVIEKANQLALQNGVTFSQVLEIAKASPIPTYLMGYFNSFYNRGLESIVSEMEKIGVLGAIIPDLPYEESAEYSSLFQKYGRELIPFVAPTDSKERVSKILKDANSGFIYLVAYAGITGSGKSEELGEVISNVREVSKTPLFIGFGVTPESAVEKSQNVDGVIVGSAFVKYLLDETLSEDEKISKIVESAKDIKEKISKD